MVRRKDLTISEEQELNWNDNMYSEEDERIYQREFNFGWDSLIRDLEKAGHTNLIFDPMQLVV